MRKRKEFILYFLQFLLLISSGTCNALPWYHGKYHQNGTGQILGIKELNPKTDFPELTRITRLMNRNKIPFHYVECQNWPDFPYKPIVKFRMAYSEKELFIQFKVNEKYIIAECQPGDENCFPANDSCVEFFVSPSSDHNYFNFEFNSIGYCLMMYGQTGPGRHRYSQESTRLIRTSSTMGSKPFGLKQGNIQWSLIVAIPFSILELKESCVKGKSWTANFYKCGDKLPERAYLTWNQVNSPNPDFHRPEDFGIIRFE